MGMRSASDWAGQRQPAPAAANRRVLAASSQAQDSAHAWTPLQIRCGAVIGDQAGAAGQGGNALGFTTKRHSTKPAQSQPCMRSTLMPRPRPTRVLERHSFAVQLVLSSSKGTRRWTERRQHWRPPHPCFPVWFHALSEPHRPPRFASQVALRALQSSHPNSHPLFPREEPFAPRARPRRASAGSERRKCIRYTQTTLLTSVLTRLSRERARELLGPHATVRDRAERPAVSADRLVK
ncbi:uncharacterized protein P884DRAFT_261854 [Thermothelomyces heterothallicus CBS 202.75]|uniref:uncharacterized protein n=1 Tax=Thermothelomyces heterothallicus CBS 202.75 TaxID=1149848 RepID=UPI00374469B8